MITTGGMTGYLAKFTAATDVESSTAIYDSSTATTTGFVGIGPLNYFSPTNLPQSALHVVTQTPPAAYVDSYSGSPTTVLNVIPTVNRSARGTPTNPSAVQLNDYLAGMAARGYGATKFANGGRSALRMQAAEIGRTRIRAHTCRSGRRARARRCRSNACASTRLETWALGRKRRRVR